MRMQALGQGRNYQVEGEMLCPPDKSITHRSFIFAAMAKGKSRISSPLLGEDCRSTLGALIALGTDVDIKASEVVVSSPGIGGWRSPRVPLDFGNSGTTARLMTGLLAARKDLFCVCYGDQSLSERPMGRVVEPLRLAGATIHGRRDGHNLPLAIRGETLRPMRFDIDKASAQIKSALILAGLSAHGRSTVVLPSGSRNHTELMLAALGASCHVDFMDEREVVEVDGPFCPPARDTTVPGDPSSAAFFAVLAAIAGKGAIRINGVLDNPTRCGFLEVLGAMGAKIEKIPVPESRSLESMVDLIVHGGCELRATVISGEKIPSLIDEIPILAIAAMYAKGQTKFCGVEELRVKESNRLDMTIALVRAGGGHAEAVGDDLVIEGTPEAIKCFRFDPMGDHRMAMAAAVLAASAGGQSEILDENCVNVSFPGFFDHLANMG